MVLGDVTAATAVQAMRGLALRADVRAHNVANVSTPGFRAGSVDFESVLREVVSRGGPVSHATPNVRPGMALPMLPSQNTVDLEGEMVGMMQDNLLRDAMVNAFNFRVNAARTAMGR